MLCHSIYLQVVEVHLFNLGLPINRYTFVLPSENQNAFRLLSICADAVYTEDISSIKIFCKDIPESLKYVDELSELKKKMTKFKKNTHLSLSLSPCHAKCRTKADAHDEMGFQYISISLDIVRSHARIQRGGGRESGPPPPPPPPHLKITKTENFSAILDRIPWNSQKLPSQHSTLGHHQHASETPFKGVSLAGRWWSAFCDIWILSPLKKKEKNVVRVRIQIRSEWNSERMFRQCKHLGMR